MRPLGPLVFVILALSSGAGCGGRTAVGADGAMAEGEGTTGDECGTDQDCESGLRCLYWRPGCEQRGVCGIPPLMDAFFTCRGVCDCAGHWRGNISTLQPFQSREWEQGPNPTCSPPDASVPDGWDPFARISYCRD